MVFVSLEVRTVLVCQDIHSGIMMEASVMAIAVGGWVDQSLHGV